MKHQTLGSLEAHEANKISHQGALVLDPAVWGGCLFMVLQSTSRMPGRACGRLNALKRSNRGLPGIGIALKLLVCF